MTDFDDVEAAVSGDPDLWMFSESVIGEDGRVETAVTYRTDGPVDTEVVTAALGSMVMKLADDTETHPAIILMDIMSSVQRNLDAPRMRLD